MVYHSGMRKERFRKILEINRDNPEEVIPISPESFSKMDPIVVHLWSRFVRKRERWSLETMKELMYELEHVDPCKSKNKILKRMFDSGIGFDGINAAGVTINNLKSICKYYIVNSDEFEA